MNIQEVSNPSMNEVLRLGGERQPTRVLLESEKVDYHLAAGTFYPQRKNSKVVVSTDSGEYINRRKD